MNWNQALVISLVTATAASAVGCSSGGPRGEIARDTAEIRVDQAQLVRDTQELDRFRAKLISLQGMDPHADSGAFRAVAGDLFSAMETEVEQAERKAKQAQAELGRSRREHRRERREAFETGTRKDVREARDDRRDRADDRRDLGSAEARKTRMKTIFDECKGLRWGVARGKDEAIARGMVLLQEFLVVMEADLAATQRELREDRRERREDWVSGRR